MDYQYKLYLLSRYRGQTNNKTIHSLHPPSSNNNNTSHVKVSSPFLSSEISLSSCLLLFLISVISGWRSRLRRHRLLVILNVLSWYQALLSELVFCFMATLMVHPPSLPAILRFSSSSDQGKSHLFIRGTRRVIIISFNGCHSERQREAALEPYRRGPTKTVKCY